jgi:hypothetical protein
VQGRKIRDEADAKVCLAAARAVGGNRATWARTHGIDARSLNAWRVALDKRAASTQRRKAVALQPKLVELVQAPASSARCVVDFGGARVEVDERCSFDTLQRVFRALRSC